MSNEVTLPELGENITSVEISSVFVSVGDTIKTDQPIVEVETEKASLEVPSTAAGTVTVVHVKPGDTVEVGSALVSLDAAASGAGVTDADPPSPARPPAPEPAEQAPAEPVAQAPPATSPPSTPAPAAAIDQAPSPPREDRGEPVPAAPSVRRLARQLGIDVRTVTGTGPSGRISLDDVKAHAKRIVTSATAGGHPVAVAAHGGPAAEPDLPDFARFGETVREPLSALRRAAAASLARSWSLIPHVTQNDEADITELEAARKRHGARVARAGGKLTVTAIAMKVAASALRRFPKFNASLDAARGEVILKSYVHLGVAVDTDRGLMVPVVRDVDRKNVAELSAELGEMAKRARDRKIMPDELQGACFTISNLGGLGTTTFTPIVNWPEVAILGIGRAQERATFVGGDLQPRMILPLSISYDHRWIDGADAARFVRWVAEALEDPLLLTLEG